MIAAYPFTPGATFPMRVRLFMTTLFPLSALFLASCETFHKAKFNRGLGVGEDLILVVPFGEPKRSRWYGESLDGKDVVQTFKVWAREKSSPRFAEGEEVERILRLILDWPKDKISGKDWAKLTTGTGIKYVLYGEIDKLSLRNPGRSGLLTPAITASYRVVDAQRGKLVFEELRNTVRSSESDRTQIVLDFDGNLDRAKKRLVGQLGRRIGEDLYGHYEDW